MTKRALPAFTLLELLISLTLMSMVMLGVYQALYVGVRTVEKGEARSVQNQHVRAAVSLIARKLKSAYPIKLTLDAETFVYFYGEPTELRFVASADRPETGGLEKVSYFIDEIDGRRGLWMRISAPTLPNDLIEDREGWFLMETELISDVTDVFWEYFGEQEDRVGWYESWSGWEQKQLPEAIRLRWRAKLGSLPEEWQIEVPVHVRGLPPDTNVRRQRRRQIPG